MPVTECNSSGTKERIDPKLKRLNKSNRASQTMQSDQVLIDLAAAQIGRSAVLMPRSFASAIELIAIHSGTIHSGTARGAGQNARPTGVNRLGVVFGWGNFGAEEFQVGSGDVAAEDADKGFVIVAFCSGVADPHRFRPNAVGAQSL